MGGSSDIQASLLFQNRWAAADHIARDQLNKHEYQARSISSAWLSSTEQPQGADSCC